MRYQYCMDCKEPIGARSTFYESVILGKSHRKKLKASCGKSKPDGFDVGRCQECQIKIMKQFNKTDCDNEHCIKMKDGKCLFLVKG